MGAVHHLIGLCNMDRQTAIIGDLWAELLPEPFLRAGCWIVTVKGVHSLALLDGRTSVLGVASSAGELGAV